MLRAPLALLLAFSAAPASASGAAAALERLCASADPVLIIDDFSADPKSRVIDPDGDGVYELNHGGFIAAVYRAYRRPYIERDLGGAPTAERILAALKAAGDEIAAGTLRVSAINLSHSLELEIEEFVSVFDSPIPAEQFAARRDEVLREAVAAGPFIGQPYLGELAAAAERLKKLGVPLLSSAGNHGAGRVNLLNVLPGAIGIGGLALDGAKAPFSGDNGLVELWAPGQFVLRRVDGGVDLNRDGRADIPDSALTGGAPLVARWNGKPADEAVASRAPDVSGDRRRRQRALGDKLYPVDALATALALKPYELADLRRLGSYFDAETKFPFERRGGVMVFDPERSGEPSQVKLVTGTSFSQGALCR